MQAIASGGAYSTAIELVAEMKSLNMTRYRSTCNAIVRSCIKANCPRIAAKALVDLFPIQTFDEKVHGAITPSYLEHVATLLDQAETLSGNVVTSNNLHIDSDFILDATPASWSIEWNIFCPQDGGSLSANIEGEAVECLRTLTRQKWEDTEVHTKNY